MKDDPAFAVLTALALKEGQQQHSAALEQLRSDPAKSDGQGGQRHHGHSRRHHRHDAPC
jgi:hypothetical protein